MSSIQPQRVLVWATLFVFCIAIVVTNVLSHKSLPEGIAIETTNQPTLGNPDALVHVVVIEEPKCISCKDYSVDVYPQIKKEFIDTNKIRYTTILVSFLPGSMPAAIALLSAYYENGKAQNSDLFFTYVDYLYEHQGDESLDWATPATLVNFAENASPKIDTHLVLEDIEKGTYKKIVEENTEYSRKIMEGHLSTPTIYVDGIKIRDVSYDAIAELIEDALKAKGVK